MLTNDILEAQVSRAPPGIFLSGIPEMKQSRADSNCPQHLHSHYTSLIYETSSFPKNLQVPPKIFGQMHPCLSLHMSDVTSNNVTWCNVNVCWIYLYKGNCNNYNNGLQKEWYMSVNGPIQYFKEIKCLTRGGSRNLPRWYWRHHQTDASTHWWQRMPEATGWAGL